MVKRKKDHIDEIFFFLQRTSEESLFLSRVVEMKSLSFLSLDSLF